MKPTLRDGRNGLCTFFFPVPFRPFSNGERVSNLTSTASPIVGPGVKSQRLRAQPTLWSSTSAIGAVSCSVRPVHPGQSCEFENNGTTGTAGQRCRCFCPCLRLLVCSPLPVMRRQDAGPCEGFQVSVGGESRHLFTVRSSSPTDEPPGLAVRRRSRRDWSHQVRAVGNGGILCLESRRQHVA